MNAVGFALQLATSIALTAWVVRRDMRRLTDEQLARSWNSASFWSAVVAFGPLCLPFHFVKSRRSLLGLGMGLLAMVLVVLGQTLVGMVWQGATGAPQP